MTAKEIIGLIKRWHEPFEEKEDCRDLVLAGDPDQQCTGICVTVCATMEVLKQAKENGLNLIITHESIFFGGRLQEEDIRENDIYQKKLQFIRENSLVVWRDHDRMHGNGLYGNMRKTPDYIFYGICKELEWESYVLGDPLKPEWYKIPTMKTEELAGFFLRKFHLNGLRIVGNRNADISTVWFCGHVMGSSRDGIKIREALRADAVIPFEICDYTLTQYVVDAAWAGRAKVIMEMGHFNCEELGMKYMVKWLPEAVGCRIPILFIPSGDPFSYYTGGK